MTVTTEELKKLSESHTLVFGANDVVRKLKQGKLESVFLASNIPEDLEEDIMHNASIGSIPVSKTAFQNTDFGVIFKRSHVLLAIGVVK